MTAVNKNQTSPILPGATLGMFGSGQLGRMFTIAARQLGYRVHVFSPEADTPTGQIADHETQADYEDLAAVEKFAKNVSVISFEFENIPVETINAAAKFAPVRPAGQVLHLVQNRLREKNFLTQAGVPCAPYRAIRSLEDLKLAVQEIGTPAILKTAAWGYDGKGQIRIDSSDQIANAWQEIGQVESVLEGFIPFEREISMLVVRGIDGSTVTYGPILNNHTNHILDTSILSDTSEDPTTVNASKISQTIATQLDVLGIICIEFFQMPDGSLVVNEIAPRPHNSGHLTVDACTTNQFEQQVRAICGLPLGQPTLLRPAAMANLLGDLWANGEPNWAAALALPDVKLHLYGKAEPRAGRKMGHLTALAETPEEAKRLVIAARQKLLS